MRAWIENGECRLKSPDNCLWCRSDEAWRAQVGLPSECPEGVTITTLPLESRPANKGKCLTCEERKKEQK